MYHLNEMTAEMDDMDHLIEDETSQREWHLEENILQWFTAFAKAALDQTPGTPNPDDIEDTAHDVAEIGRASCRERVQISEDDVAVKKKKRYQQREKRKQETK